MRHCTTASSMWDAYNNYHMGTTAENICDVWGITREELDEVFKLPFTRTYHPSYEKLGGVDAADEETIQEFIREYKRQYPPHMAAGARLIQNARETMEKISGAGYPICLITSERRANAQFILDRLGLAPFIPNLISRDDAEKFKPDPEPLLKAMKLLGLPPEACVYIGESPFDIEAGVASGAFVVGVASGNWSAQSLVEQCPDVLADDISELLPLFGCGTAI